MAKNKILGIEIGNSRIKIAVCSNGKIERLVKEDIPDNLVVEDEIVSWEAMADFVKTVVKENNVTYKDVHMVLPERHSYIRRLTMPAMSIEQLKVNLPFEFHEYITEDKEAYVYDYSVVEVKKDGEGKPVELDLMGIAASKELIEKYKTMFRRAGLRMILIAPEYVAFKNIIRRSRHADEKDYAILDMGDRYLRLHFFDNGEYEITRNMEPGCDEITRAIADKLDVDIHIAQITKESNKDNILDSDECREVYNQMAVEIMRVLNFYNFNHQDNTLEKLYCCGGGVFVKPLMDAIQDMIELEIEGIDELMADVSSDKEVLYFGPQALGIAWE